MTPVEYVCGPKDVLAAVLVKPERAVAGALILSLACLTGEQGCLAGRGGGRSLPDAAVRTEE